jgi:hypothetical protein
VIRSIEGQHNWIFTCNWFEWEARKKSYHLLVLVLVLDFSAYRTSKTISGRIVMIEIRLKKHCRRDRLNRSLCPEETLQFGKRQVKLGKGKVECLRKPVADNLKIQDESLKKILNQIGKFVEFKLNRSHH